MGGFCGAEGRDYVLLKNLKVEFRGDDDKGEDDAGEKNGCFALCFWIYIDNCASVPSVIVAQKQSDATSSVPFLYLDDNRKLKLFPLLLIHKDAPDPDNPISWNEGPCVLSKTEFLAKKWVHVGCEVRKDLMRLHIDGKIVGEMPLTCSLDDGLHGETLKGIHLACPNENKDILHGYVYGLDVFFQASTVKSHHVKDPPAVLSIDHSSASEIEEDSDGVWSIVGGKASCRRIFSLDVTLSDAFGYPANAELEVVASLLYADNGVPVDNTSDAEPPLLANCDGIEYDSRDRPCKLINGRASFKLKISKPNQAHHQSGSN